MGLFSVLSIVTIAQYTIFLGIALVLFGWFEKKDRLTYGGLAVFILLGIFATGVLLTTAPVLTEMKENTISKELKTVSYMKMITCFSILCLISMILGWRKKRFYKAGLFLVVIIGLSLFFVAVNILQVPAK